MIASDVEQLRRNPLLVPITVDQYHQMIAGGILEEGAPIELISGILVEKDRRAYVPGQPQGGQVVPLTVWQYHEMIRAGILREGEPIELIEGLLVRKDRSQRGEDPMTVGYRHALVVDELAALNDLIRSHGCFIRARQPITLTPENEPEPDGAIVRGSPRSYAKALPTATDVLCIFEVADSSLNDDRTTKQRIYAVAEIPLYVIINLIDQMIEWYSMPDCARGRYGSLKTLGPGEMLRLPTGTDIVVEVPVERLLP